MDMRPHDMDCARTGQRATASRHADEDDESVDPAYVLKIHAIHSAVVCDYEEEALNPVDTRALLA